MSVLNTFDFSNKFDEWEQLRDVLAPLFRLKDETRKRGMENGIQLLSAIIENAEGTMPVNYFERIEFIKQNATNYSAFRQLDELFKETKKKVAGMRNRK